MPRLSADRIQQDVKNNVPTLTHFCLNRIEEGDAIPDAKNLLDIFKKNTCVTTFEHHGDIGNQYLLSAITSIVKNNSNITSFILSFNDNIDETEFLNFCSAIQNSTHILSLYVSGIENDEFIINHIKNHPSLTEFTLSGNFSHQGAQALAKVIEGNTNLKKLAIYTYISKVDDYISDDKSFLLGNALKNNKTLVSLSLSNNRISDIGAQYIIDALSMNKTLVELDLSWNHINNLDMNNVLSILKKNKIIQDLKLRKNPPFKEANENHDMFYDHYDYDNKVPLPQWCEIHYQLNLNKFEKNNEGLYWFQFSNLMNKDTLTTLCAIWLSLNKRDHYQHFKYIVNNGLFSSNSPGLRERTLNRAPIESLLNYIKHENDYLKIGAAEKLIKLLKHIPTEITCSEFYALQSGKLFELISTFPTAVKLLEDHAPLISRYGGVIQIG